MLYLAPSQGATDPSFLWVFILMKLQNVLQDQQSNLTFSFCGTRCILERKSLILSRIERAILLGPKTLVDEEGNPYKLTQVGPVLGLS